MYGCQERIFSADNFLIHKSKNITRYLKKTLTATKEKKLFVENVHSWLPYWCILEQFISNQLSLIQVKFAKFHLIYFDFSEISFNALNSVQLCFFEIESLLIHKHTQAVKSRQAFYLFFIFYINIVYLYILFYFFL